MLTPDEFRALALSLAGAEEKQHMGHPDFRVNNKVFASLGYPDAQFATVMLDPESQREFIAEGPTVFSPARGAWGAKGATLVALPRAQRETAEAALQAAWRIRRAKRR